MASKKSSLGVPGTASQQLMQRANNMKAKPREKVELKPGRSLMDWIRFSNSAKDLAGNGGKMLQIPKSELVKHNKIDDAWTCIRGYVYNITPYLEFHPGGIDELLRGAGKDGTTLFDEYHRWVNIESMLAKCLIGKLASEMKLGSPSFNPKISSSSEGSLFAKPLSSAKPPSSSGLPTTLLSPAESNVPKFDWHEKEDRVTLVVYTKSLATTKENIIIHLTDKVLLLKVIIKDHVYKVHIKLQFDVLPLFDITIDKSGKVEVTFLKCEEQKWEKIGEFLTDNESYKKLSDCLPEYFKMRIEEVQKINHDTALYCINIPDGSHVCIPMGYHVYLQAQIECMDISRPYTVVLPAISKNDIPDEVTTGEKIYLLIKIYNDGIFTPILKDIPNGIDILVSDFEGDFDERKLNECSEIILLAAGTGFTPMIRLINKVLKCNKEDQKEVKLLFFNKTEEDILWRDQLEALANDHSNFRVTNILSRPSLEWKGLKGRIRKDIVENFISEKQHEKKYLLCACGPTQFTEEAVRLIKEFGYSENDIHAFMA